MKTAGCSGRNIVQCLSRNVKLSMGQLLAAETPWAANLESWDLLLEGSGITILQWQNYISPTQTTSKHFWSQPKVLLSLLNWPSEFSPEQFREKWHFRIKKSAKFCQKMLLPLIFIVVGDGHESYRYKYKIIRIPYWREDDHICRKMLLNCLTVQPTMDFSFQASLTTSLSLSPSRSWTTVRTLWFVELT